MRPEVKAHTNMKLSVQAHVSSKAEEKGTPMLIRKFVSCKSIPRTFICTHQKHQMLVKLWFLKKKKNKSDIICIANQGIRCTLSGINEMAYLSVLCCFPQKVMAEYWVQNV